jgi:hypothetical protein
VSEQAAGGSARADSSSLRTPSSQGWLTPFSPDQPAPKVQPQARDPLTIHTGCSHCSSPPHLNAKDAAPHVPCITIVANDIETRGF